MRLLAALLLATVASSAMAFGDYIDNSDKAGAKASAKASASAKAGALAVAAPITLVKSSPSATIQAAAPAKAPDIPPIVASATAAPPSAQCRFGWGGQFGVQEFGFGISGSDWDRICGLWLAAQQTTGTASNEAATAAYCLTMQDAKVHSATCADWENGQNLAMAEKVKLNDRGATVVFGGSSGWN